MRIALSLVYVYVYIRFVYIEFVLIFFSRIVLFAFIYIILRALFYIYIYIYDMKHICSLHMRYIVSVSHGSSFGKYSNVDARLHVIIIVFIIIQTTESHRRMLLYMHIIHAWYIYIYTHTHIRDIISGACILWCGAKRRLRKRF
jgi:hypothetical protein